MKHSFILSVLAAFAVSTSASAESFSFHYNGNYSGGYTMVSCDYAEYQAEMLLEKFGASDIETSCFGGINPNGMVMPLSMTVKFTGVTPGTDPLVRKETFASDGFGSNACDFNVRLTRAAVASVKNVKITRSNTGCMSGASSFSFDFDVFFPR